MIELRDRIPDFENPIILQLFNYWRGLCREGKPPGREGIDPLAIPRVLPCIWIYDWQEDGRFLCRLAGENIRTTLGRKVIGEYMDQFVGDPGYPILKDQYEAVLTLPAVGHTVGNVYTAGTPRYGVGERLILPLCDATGVPRHLLGATTYGTTAPPIEPLPQVGEIGAPGSAQNGPQRSLTPLEAILD